MRALKLLTAAALLSVAHIGTTVAAGDVVKIGVLTDMSSVFSDGNGAGSVVAAKLAVEDFGPTLDGKRIEIVYADHQNKPDVGISIARKWFENEGVDAIADIGNSAVALGVANVARKDNKAVLISSAGSPVLTGKSCSPNTVQWTWNSHSAVVPLVDALTKAGKKKWFFITADYVFGTSLQDEATAELKRLGGTVAGAVRVPLNTMDFSSFLLQAQASGADVVALANGGGDVDRAIKQAQEFGLTKHQSLAALSFLLTDVKAVGIDKAQGLTVSLPFYWDMNEGTRSFAERWSKQSNGRMPTMMQAGVYSVVLHYLKAAKAAGGTADGAKVVEEMKKLPADDPAFGRTTVLANGRGVHDVYVLQVKTPAESKKPWDYFKLVATIPGSQAFRPASESGCPLVAGNAK
jgi:branched-chain amino acid transport system substrate-binding protein